jgi:hypothetical protein
MNVQERRALKALIPPYWAPEADAIIDTAERAGFTPTEFGAVTVQFNLDTVIYNSYIRLAWPDFPRRTVVLAP